MLKDSAQSQTAHHLATRSISKSTPTPKAARRSSAALSTVIPSAGNLLSSVPCLPAVLTTRKPCFPLLSMRMEPWTNSLLMYITPSYFPRIYFHTLALNYMVSECDSSPCHLTEIPRCSRTGDLLPSQATMYFARIRVSRFRRPHKCSYTIFALLKGYHFRREL